MWTPAWFDTLFALLTHPVTWVAIGIVLGLLAAWVLRSAWRVMKARVSRG
jgi:hypothetical protein